MKIEINEKNLTDILKKDRIFNSMLYGYTDYNMRQRYISYAVQDLKNQNQNKFIIEKEIYTDIEEFVKYIKNTNDSVNYLKQMLWIVIKDYSPEFEKEYISILKEGKKINLNEAKFILNSMNKGLLEISDKDLMIDILKIIAKENSKSYSKNYLKEMKDLFKEKKYFDLYKNDLKEIIENYHENQTMLNKKDYAFLNRNKAKIYEIYEGNKLPKFLHDLYTHKSELETEVVYKTKKELFIDFPLYFRKDNGTNISLKKELMEGKLSKKEILENPKSYPTLYISFEYNRFATNNNSDSVHLGGITYGFAKVLKNLAKKEDLNLNDFMSRTQNGSIKYALVFNEEQDALKIKNVLSNFIQILAQHSIDKYSKKNIDWTNEEELEKYLSYYILNNEIDNVDKKTITKRNKI